MNHLTGLKHGVGSLQVLTNRCMPTSASPKMGDSPHFWPSIGNILMNYGILSFSPLFQSRISIKFQPQSLARTCAFLLRACRYMSDCTCVVCSISSKWEIFSTSIGTGFRACQKCQQHQKVKIENETTWLVVEPYPSEK